MKKFLFSAAVMAATLMLASCSGVSKEQYQQATNTNDSLMLVALQQGNEIYDLQTTLQNVTDQLDQINGQLSVSNGEDKNLVAQRESLMQKLNLVQQTILEKQAALEELQKKYSAQLGQNKELKKTIDRLQNEVTGYQAEIKNYQNQIVAKDQQIADLSENLSSTQVVLEETQAKNEVQQTVIDTQDKMLNTGYYIVADKKTLKNKGLIEGGAFSKKRLTTDGFSTAGFNEIDIREVTKIDINDKSPKVMTSHPANSYELVKHDDGTSSLVIKDQAAFWSNSKFLIVME